MSISDSVDIRVKHPTTRNDEEVMITTLKSHVDDTVEERTIKRTVNEEKADLQVKWIKHSNEIVHMHCMKDKKSNEWGKASRLPVENFYRISRKETEIEITCNKCGRTWNTAGLPPTQ